MRLERPYFEALYATRPDPWDFSPCEREKYERTLEALGPPGRRVEQGMPLP